MEEEEEEEEDEEEEFECPCGHGCDTISDCEKRSKEVMGRDVGMRLVVHLNFSHLLWNHRITYPVFNLTAGL